MIVRQTNNFAIEYVGPHCRPVLFAKSKSVTPRRCVLSDKDCGYLRQLDDNTFDAACVIDFGVGVHQRKAVQL